MTLSKKARILIGTGMIISTGLVLGLSQNKGRNAAHPLDFAIPNAWAGKFLNPQSISFATAAGRGDFVRFLYFMVNGAPTGYSFMGPDGGFVGMIKNMTNKLGGGLARAGYTTCAEIPTTGSVTHSITKDGVAMSMTMAFSTGTKLIPTGYTGAGALFEKRVTVSRGDDTVMAFEMTCDSGSGVKRGYILADKDLMKESGREIKRGMEIYFERNESTNAGKVDLLQAAEGTDSNSEKLGVTFSTTDGDSFSLYLIRTTANGGDSFGIWGSRSTNKATLNSIHQVGATTNTSAIHTVTNGANTFTECLDFSADTVVTGSGCPSATAHPGAASFNGLTPNWNISGIAGATITPI